MFIVYSIHQENIKPKAWGRSRCVHNRKVQRAVSLSANTHMYLMHSDSDARSAVWNDAIQKLCNICSVIATSHIQVIIWCFIYTFTNLEKRYFGVGEIVIEDVIKLKTKQYLSKKCKHWLCVFSLQEVIFVL